MTSSTEFTATPIKAEDMRAFGEVFCDGYELAGDFTLADIADFVTRTSKAHPGHRLLATLDDFGQACYTFGHACGFHLNEDSDPEFPWEDLPQSERFAKRKANFETLLKEVSLDGIRGQRFWQDASQDYPSVATNGAWLRETQTLVQIVPVHKACDALIAFPNGYFTDDYSPLQNYRLAEHLETEFGFALFGVGASYLGFNRDTALNPAETKSLAAFLASLFPETNIAEKLEAQLIEQAVFYFCFAER